MKNIKRIGIALESTGVTITGYSAVQMTQWLLITGLALMALGRGLVKYASV